jgi:hypothetical protein
MGLGLVLVVWWETRKLKDLEKVHYLDLRKDSRLAQEYSLQLLYQKEKEKEKE